MRASAEQIAAAIESVLFVSGRPLERGELRNGEEIVRLTEREREILRLLGATPGMSVSREALSSPGASAQERTVDVQINRLRRKIERDPTNPLHLQTARGSGYKLVVDP